MKSNSSLLFQLGPNVSVGANASIGPGSRVKESIILEGSSVGEHSLILYTVIGRNTTVGDWTRVEGSPDDPNPNKPFAKMDNQPLFNAEGKLNPSITVLGEYDISFSCNMHYCGSVRAPVMVFSIYERSALAVQF